MCLALALANQRGIKVETELHIALAESPRGRLPVIGGYRKEKET